jgi:DNA (cytosine-5)-methyltransferase 1
VFVVASARDDINPAEILFEFEGVRRDTPQSRKEGKVTPTLSSSGTRVRGVGFNCEDQWFIETPFVGALDTECGGTKMNHQTIASGHIFPVKSFYESSLAQYREANVSGTIKASGGVAGGGSETFLSQPIAFTTEQTPKFNDDQALTLTKSESKHNQCVAQPMVWDTTNITSPQNGSNPQPGDPCFTLAKGQHPPLLTNVEQPMTVAPTLTASNDPSRSPQSTEVTNQVAAVHSVSMAVRRLTPVECERLQGFPDGYTNIPWRGKDESPDGPRYKALGNSWAVPVVAWIGKRIQDQIK